MTKRPTGPTLRRISALFRLGAVGTLTDGQLLERFAAGDGGPAELAFATLIERHGPMVLGVCKAILGDEDAARDAFQATFLVLIRKADSLWVRDSLGPWLYRVAHRAAQKARADAGRRRIHERRAAQLRAASGEPGGVGDDTTMVLHEEIARLPVRYRIPLILCDLEGRTHEEAARHLRCPIGTIKSRLARGRGRLRDRMTRRGIVLSAGVIAAHSAEVARAAIPEALVRGTIEIVKGVVTGQSAAGTLSTAIILARGINRTMIQMHLAKTAAFVTATVLLLALGAGAVIRQDEDASTQPTVVPKHTIKIHVADEEGRPLSEARVFRNHVYKLPGNERSLIENRDDRTDAKGNVAVVLSGTSVDLRIWASDEGFVPMHAMWAKQFQADGDRIPDEFTFKLKRGTSIGGMVVDERDRPIAGVKVEVRDRTAERFHRINPAEPGKRPVRSYSLAEGDDVVITDARGRWKLDNVPADEDLVSEPAGPIDPRFRPSHVPLPIGLHVSHPGYNNSVVRNPRPGTETALKSLRDRTAKSVLVKE